MLRPQKHIQKCLLSTPAHLVGEFESPDVLITHAWPDMMAPNPVRIRMEAGPQHRRFFVAAFETDEDTGPKTIGPLPNYHWVGDVFAACLGVFFGKSFDHHGLIESCGHFSLPSLQQLPEIASYRRPPFNSKPRVDFPEELNLTRLQKIEPLLRLQVNSVDFDAFITASHFYLRALRHLDIHLESAYLDLVTAGEVISNCFDYNDDELFDDDLRNLLSEVETLLPDGGRKSRLIKGRLFQVRKRFKLAIGGLLDDSFFERTESAETWARFRLRRKMPPYRRRTTFVAVTSTRANVSARG